jgi:hypothetical protein
LPFAFCLLTSFTLACGRKAPPRPPQDVMPKTIEDLAASNVRDGIELSWARPRLYADGTRLTDLGGFLIERVSGSAAGARFERLAEIEVTDRERFQQIKRFRYVDRSVTGGGAYAYRVVSFTVDRYFSAPSNAVSIERQHPHEEGHAPLPTPQR